MNEKVGKIIMIAEITAIVGLIIASVVMVSLSSGDLVGYVQARGEYADIISSFTKKKGSGGKDDVHKEEIKGTLMTTLFDNVIPERQIDPMTEYDIDFDSLSERNSDVVGWIYIPGTQCDYPVVKGEDNDEYIKKTFYGTKSSSGSIFMEKECNSDFSSDVTLLYGHNMKDGSMFRAVRNYKDVTYYEEHPYVYIYTPDRKMKMRVIASMTVKPKSKMYQFFFENREKYEKYLDSVRDNVLYKAGNISYDDKTVLLSTCTGRAGENRFIVFLQPEEVIGWGDNGESFENIVEEGTVQ